MVSEELCHSTTQERQNLQSLVEKNKKIELIMRKKLVNQNRPITNIEVRRDRQGLSVGMFSIHSKVK